MAYIKICDVCRKIPHPMEDDTSVLDLRWGREDLIGWSLGRKRQIDICRECHNRMIEFMKREKVNKTN